mmetsp:Transcript_47621/g.152592  ORF Transcript_47621/g.152592 Transcript_47621/m.152592 type:complete len:658 (-) Transcript_47621:149-2122(-)
MERRAPQIRRASMSEGGSNGASPRTPRTRRTEADKQQASASSSGALADSSSRRRRSSGSGPNMVKKLGRMVTEAALMDVSEVLGHVEGKRNMPSEELMKRLDSEKEQRGGGVRAGSFTCMTHRSTLGGPLMSLSRAPGHFTDRPSTHGGTMHRRPSISADTLGDTSSEESSAYEESDEDGDEYGVLGTDRLSKELLQLPDLGRKMARDIHTAATPLRTRPLLTRTPEEEEMSAGSSSPSPPPKMKQSMFTASLSLRAAVGHGGAGGSVMDALLLNIGGGAFQSAEPTRKDLPSHSLPPSLLRNDRALKRLNNWEGELREAPEDMELKNAAEAEAMDSDILTARREREGATARLAMWDDMNKGGHLSHISVSDVCDVDYSRSRGKDTTALGNESVRMSKRLVAALVDTPGVFSLSTGVNASRQMEAIASSIISNLDDIHTIILSQTNMDDTSLGILLEGLRKFGSRPIKILDVSDNRLTHHGAAVMGENLNPSRKGRLGSKGVLHIEELHLGNNPIGDTGCATFADKLGHNQCLVRLHLNQCGVADRGALALGNALQNNNRLEELYLQWNKVGTRGAKAMAEGLAWNQSLKLLDVARNGFGDKGGAHLAECLGSNTCLREINLEGNGISSKSCVVFAGALKKNTTLQVGCIVATIFLP